MTFETTIPSALNNAGDVHFKHHPNSPFGVGITRSVSGKDRVGTIYLSELAKLAQVFAGSRNSDVVSVRISAPHGSNADGVDVAISEILEFVAALTRKRATTAILLTLKNLETSSAEELIGNFAETDLWEYLALHNEPKPSPLV